MGDLVLLAVLVAFFGLALLLVRGCERIVGPDETAVRSPHVEPGIESERAA